MAIAESTLSQLRILDLPNALPPGEAAIPLQQSDVGFPDQDRSDSALLREAVNNRFLSEAFVASRGLIGTWNISELILRAETKIVKWKNSDQVRSHLGIPLLAEHFYAMLSSVQQSIWSGVKLFQIDPTSDTPIDAAVAQEALINAEIKNCGYKNSSLKQEFRSVLYDGFLYGLGAAMMGWETKSYRVMKQALAVKTKTISTPSGASYDVPTEDEDEDTEWKPNEIQVNMPHFEHIPLRRLRVAPDCRKSDIRTASWAGRLLYLSAYDLDKLRDTDCFKIPTREQLVQLTTPQKMDGTSANPMDSMGGNPLNPIFQQTTTPQKAQPENYSEGGTVDPLAKKFEVFDYWTEDRHAMILEGQYCLLNEANDDRKIPFLSFAYREAPDSLYGYGLGFWLADFQRICTGIVNAFFDDLNLNLMGTYTAPAGLANSAQNQWIFPGKVFKSDAAGKVETLTRNAIEAKEPLAVIAQIKEWASQISGAGAGTLGSNPGSPGDVRTKQNVQLMAGGEATKAQDLMDVISDQILLPFLEFCVEQNRKLKPSQIRQMLSQELSQALSVTPISVINGTYKLNITAGAKLAARLALASSLGFIESTLNAPGVMEMLGQQGMKFDFQAFITALFEVTGYPYREQMIKPMTDEDKQRFAASQGQPDKSIQKIAAQVQGKKEVDENQGEIRMALKTGEAALKSAASTQDHHEARQQNVEQAAMDQAHKLELLKSDAQFHKE